MVEWITEMLEVKSVIDVGCGPGHLMSALQQRGVKPFGIDVSDAALQRTREKRLEVQHFDLRTDGSLPGIPYDLAVCCEVAEHIDEKSAESLVGKLTEAAPVVYMTAAEPDGAPGLFHVNEQEHEYWIELTKAKGYRLDEELTESARQFMTDEKVVPYLARPLVFRASEETA